MAQPSPFAQETSRLVRQYAAGRKITRKQISDTLGLNVGSVSRRLNGHEEFSLTELAKLGPLLEVDPAELVARGVTA